MIDPDLRARADGAGLVLEFNGDVRGYFGPKKTRNGDGAPLPCPYKGLAGVSA